MSWLEHALTLVVVIAMAILRAFPFIMCMLIVYWVMF